MKKKSIVIIVLLVFIITFWGVAKTFKSSDTDINDDNNFSLEIVTSDSLNIKQLDLSDLYDYNIFYYHISDAILTYKGSSYGLEDALKQGVISMDKIIEICENYANENKISSDTYLDGGSKIYKFDNFTIIKCNIDGSNNSDVYIGVSGMNLSDITDSDSTSTLSESTDWLEQE